jgi:hypothetical protein
MADESYIDLLEALKWGVQLELTADQRACLREYCSKIAGTLTEGEFQGPGVPSWRLKQEAENKRAAIARAVAAEQRVAELEAALKADRDEWVFRRQRHA